MRQLNRTVNRDDLARPIGPDKLTAAYHLPIEDSLAQLASTPKGLSAIEAADRLKEFGPNRLPEAKGKTIAGVFFSQFRSPFIYLLLAAGAVSIGIGHFIDAVFILVVLLINAAVGTYQEWRAEGRARALSRLVRGSAAVWRDEKLQRLPVEALVPGDIVRVESGDKVPADLRLIETQRLFADESLLTGESFAVQKSAQAIVASDAPLADRSTMLHAGTTVQSGRALALVVTTGQRTVVGMLAAVLEKPEFPPPLLRRMAVFSRQVALAMLGIILVIAVLEWLRGAAAADIFLLAVALAVSAIPEGLPVAITVALSIATHRMGLRHVVVKHLPAVEGLGACNVIATDKTGTLTLNQLTIEKVWLPDGTTSDPDDPASASLLMAGSHASELLATAEGAAFGDAVDLAFIASARAHGGGPDLADKLLVERIPYEPDKRFAAAFHRSQGGIMAYAKGAPETILTFCRDADEASLEASRRLSAEGYRVIAVAAGSVVSPDENGLRNLNLVGLAAIIDPLRPEAKDAVQTAQAAKLQVVMVTGDHPMTALAIARQLGLARQADEVITGADLTKLESDELDTAVAQAKVFARTEPLQKLAIVESLRRQGKIVAVTGDGINDAAALHAADIGVAMGRSGTDVAREAADLILTDDNFSSIVAGIEEGRIAYDNVRKVILLTISTGAAEILLLLLSALSGLPPPLTAVQLLWLNLITNGIQDVALAFEQGEPGVLQREPRPAEAQIFDRRMIEQIVVSGCTIGILAYAYYFAAITAGLAHGAAQGAVLWLLVWCENAHCFNSRSETQSALRIPLRNNPMLISAVVVTQVIQILALSAPPLRELLSLEALSMADGLYLAAGGIIVLAVMEIYKLIRRRSPLQPVT